MAAGRAGTTADPSGLADVDREGIAEFLRMGARDVDLVGHAAKAESHRLAIVLLQLLAIDVVDEMGDGALRHGFQSVNLG